MEDIGAGARLGPSTLYPDPAPTSDPTRQAKVATTAAPDRAPPRSSRPTNHSLSITYPAPHMRLITRRRSGSRRSAICTCSMVGGISCVRRFSQTRNAWASSLVGQLLLGTEFSGVVVPVARVAAIALIGLGIACWPGPPLVGMLAYRALVNALSCLPRLRRWVGWRLSMAGGCTPRILVNSSRSRVARH